MPTPFTFTFSKNMQNTKINAIVTKSAFLIFGNISKMLRLHFRRFHCYNIRDRSNNMTFSSVDPAWNAFYSYYIDRLWQMAFSASTLSGTSKRISDSSVKTFFRRQMWKDSMILTHQWKIQTKLWLIMLLLSWRTFSSQ